jgi:serine/threonine protein kinase
VLVFEDRPGIYTAKVADFGFSTHFYGEQDLISMPKSVPWNAPEHHHRCFLPQRAKAMDVYSFSMLCLWLFFCVETPETILHPPGVANEDGSFSFEARDWSQKESLLRSWKSDRLLDWAIQLAAKNGHLSTDMKNSMTQFFRSSLCFDPQKRITDWSCLLSFLNPAR